ncbi:hypothetical protein QTP88_027586 [Uroleucon formosanum]
MANALGISYGSVQNILKDDLGMRRVCAKFVPRILTEDQMENRKLITAELFERSVNENDFLLKIVTGDETWVFAYDPETKLQSSEWQTTSSPKPKKSRVVKSQLKVMLIVFFHNEGLVHWEFVPNGQTVNSSFYIDVLKRLRDSIRRKRQRKWENGWFLHHDNAPCHSSFAVRQFSTDKKISTIPQPPYSPDIAPCDFWLFPNLNLGLKGERFATIEDIKVNATANLRAIPIEGYQRCFQQLQSRWSHEISDITFSRNEDSRYLQSSGVSAVEIHTPQRSYGWSVNNKDAVLYTYMGRSFELYSAGHLLALGTTKLIQAIKNLEDTKLTLVQSLEIMKNIISELTNIQGDKGSIIKTKITQLHQKNKRFQVMEQIGLIISALHLLGYHEAVDSNTASDTRNLLEKWTNFEIILTSFIFLHIFEASTPVSAHLQTKNLDYIAAWNHISSLQEKMEKLATNFAEIYQKVKDFITVAKSKTECFEHVNLNDELPVHRPRKKNEWTVN